QALHPGAKTKPFGAAMTSGRPSKYTAALSLLDAGCIRQKAIPLKAGSERCALASPATANLDDELEQVTRGAGPCVMVLFGAAGDLTKRKLIPALFNLVKAGLLSH